MKKVLFIGLSDKVGCTPLQSGTTTGDIVDQMIEKINADCFKINLVDFAPLDENNKLRYPNKEEMDKGYEHLKLYIEDLKPVVCVLLGDKVTKYLKNKITNYISIKHPSYIAVYQNKSVDEYINISVQSINDIIHG